MTKEAKLQKIKDVNVSSSDVYKSRFTEYGQIYSDSWPEPSVPPGKMGGPGGADLGAQKTALTRKVRYNDKSTTQNSSVTGAKNNA